MQTVAQERCPKMVTPRSSPQPTAEHECMLHEGEKLNSVFVAITLVPISSLIRHRLVTWYLGISAFDY